MLAVVEQVAAVVLEAGALGGVRHAAAERVAHLGGGREDDAPAGRADAAAEVGVLLVEEEALVEAGDGVEGRRGGSAGTSPRPSRARARRREGPRPRRGRQDRAVRPRRTSRRCRTSREERQVGAGRDLDRAVAAARARARRSPTRRATSRAARRARRASRGASVGVGVQEQQRAARGTRARPGCRRARSRRSRGWRRAASAGSAREPASAEPSPLALSTTTISRRRSASVAQRLEPFEERLARLEGHDHDRDPRVSLTARGSQERLARQPRRLGPGVAARQRARPPPRARARVRLRQHAVEGRARSRPRRADRRAAPPPRRSRRARAAGRRPAARRARGLERRQPEALVLREEHGDVGRGVAVGERRVRRRSRRGGRCAPGPATRPAAPRSIRGWVRFSPTTSSTQAGVSARAGARRRAAAPARSGGSGSAPTVSRQRARRRRGARRASSRGGAAGRSSSAPSGTWSARSPRSGKSRPSSRRVNSEHTGTKREARSDAAPARAGARRRASRSPAAARRRTGRGRAVTRGSSRRERAGVGGGEEDVERVGRARPRGSSHSCHEEPARAAVAERRACGRRVVEHGVERGRSVEVDDERVAGLAPVPQQVAQVAAGPGRTSRELAAVDPDDQRASGQGPSGRRRACARRCCSQSNARLRSRPRRRSSAASGRSSSTRSMACAMTVRVARVHEARRVARDLGQRRAARAHDRQPGGHRLDHRQAEALLERGQHRAAPRRPSARGRRRVSR